MENKIKLTNKQKKGQKVLEAIYLKAWTDFQFKKELLADPEKALEKYFGTSFSGEKKIVVIDQSNPDYIYINIPVKPNLEDLQLSKEELDIISGGCLQLSRSKLFTKQFKI